MKTNITILTIACTWIAAAINAQSGLTQSDFITTGVEVVQHSDTQDNKFLIASADTTGNTWDFSGLQSHETNSYRFHNADWLPEVAKLYPKANQIVEVNQGAYFQFRIVSNKGIIQWARAQKGSGGSANLQVIADTQEQIRFPVSMGTAIQSDTWFNGVVKGEVGIAIIIGFVDSFRADLFTFNEYQAMGTGELKLPNGFEVHDALMVSRVETTFAKFYLLINNQWLEFSEDELKSFGANVPSPVIEYSHNWYHLKEKNTVPLLEYNYEAGGIYASNIRFLAESAKPTSLEKRSQPKVTLFPNPANDLLYIQGLSKPNGVYQIIDMMGRTIRTGHMHQGKIRLDGIIPGSYIMKLIDETSEGETLRFQKR